MTETRPRFTQCVGALLCPNGTAGSWRTVRRARWFSVACPWLLVALSSALPAVAAVCPSVGQPVLGVEPQILIDATCEDPGFNEKNFVIDKVSQATLTVKGTGQQIPYTDVDGHFNPTQTQAALPPGAGSSPTTVRHGVKWLFPARQFWHNRFFDAVYPLPLSQSFTGDPTFEFTHGGYLVNVRPGSPTWDIGWMLQLQSLQKRMPTISTETPPGYMAMFTASVVDQFRRWGLLKAQRECGTAQCRPPWLQTDSLFIRLCGIRYS